MSPIPFERIFAARYFIPPIFLTENHFGRKVEYVPDVQRRKDDAVRFEVNAGRVDAQISDPTGIASLKSPDWAFQKEYRFVLLIVPSPDIPQGEMYFEEFSRQLPNFVVTSLYQGKGPELEYFDVDAGEEALKSIIVTAGPMCTEGDRVVIEALIEKHSPTGRMDKSKFTGTIRKPFRN